MSISSCLTIDIKENGRSTHITIRQMRSAKSPTSSILCAQLLVLVVVTVVVAMSVIVVVVVTMIVA